MEVIGKIQSEALRAMLEAWATANLALVDLSLFVNDVNANPNAPATDYTEATFPGYAAVSISPQGLADIVPGGIQQSLESAFFQANADVDPPQVVYGWFILDGAGGVFAAGRLTDPVSINTTNDFVNVTPIVEIKTVGQ